MDPLEILQQKIGNTSAFGSNQGILGLSDQGGGASALGLEGAFPMPSDLNRAGAIIAGQEDPAIKQQAVNLQTALAIGTLKEKQEANKRQSINDLLDFASKLDLDDETTTKITKMVISSNPHLKEYFGSQLENLSVSLKSKTPIILTKYFGDNELPDPTSTVSNPKPRLPAGWYKTKGRMVRGEFIPSEVEEAKPTDLKERAVAAIGEDKPLPGFTLEETKKLAGGLVEGQKLTPQQEAFKKLTPAEQRQVVLREGQPDKPLTTKEKQNIAGQIMGEARRQVEGQFKGILGQIDISSLGKTPDERGKKFRELINNTAAEIARERGFDFADLRKEGSKPSSPITAKQARTSLTQKIASGEITTTSQAEQFLIDQGIPASNARFIVNDIQKKK